MSLRDARSAMREADAAFASTPLPASALSRLRRRVLAEAHPSSWRWAAAVGAVAAAVAVAFVVWPRAPEVEDIALAPTQHYAADGVDITANTSSQLHRDHDRLAVRSGEVEVSVRKRSASSHGMSSSRCSWPRIVW